MSLSHDLAARWQRMAESSPEIRDAYEALVRDLAAGGMADRSLRAGDPLPDFELPNVEGRLVAARELLRRGPLVLSFFRGGWCPYCTLELKALQKALPEIAAMGAGLAAVTPDTGSAFALAKRTNALSYEVLSDVDNGLGLSLGIIFRVPDRIRDLYLRLGIDLGARHGGGAHWFLPLPATYVVDQAGIIRHAELNPDFRQRMEPSSILTLLRGVVANKA